jgi:MoaA/NifB/PqqE/SkfB family radical SAM enzyme
MNIAYTCFEVSGICNMDCKFCFSEWRKNKKQMDNGKAKHVLDVLKKCGLKAINLTGGEPLLRDDIVELCKYAKQIGLMTIVSTNGILFSEKERILDYIYSINLPLDSFIPKIHNKMRPCNMENHHEHVLYLIDYISKNYPNVKIKINTMVSKKNIDEILEIGKLINGKVFRWKLSKFLSSGYGKEFNEQFDVSKEDFVRISEMAKQKFKDTGIIDEEYEIEEDYDLFIDGNARIIRITENGLVDNGDIDNLFKLKAISDKNGLWNGYLNTVYEYGGNK